MGDGEQGVHARRVAFLPATRVVAISISSFLGFRGTSLLSSMHFCEHGTCLLYLYNSIYLFIFSSHYWLIYRYMMTTRLILHHTFFFFLSCGETAPSFLSRLILVACLLYRVVFRSAGASLEASPPSKHSTPSPSLPLLSLSRPENKITHCACIHARFLGNRTSGG